MMGVVSSTPGAGRAHNLDRALGPLLGGMGGRRGSSKGPAGRLHAVAPFRWLANLARSSPFLKSAEVSVIPYGLDTETFAPRDRAFSRDLLGIPRDAKTLLFVAMSSDMRRKGFAVLAEVVRRLSSENVFLISVGGGNPQVDPRVRHLHLGNVENDRLLSLVYSAADVFVIPSCRITCRIPCSSRWLAEHRWPALPSAVFRKLCERAIPACSCQPAKSLHWHLP